MPAGGNAAHVIVVDEDGHNWSAAAAEFLALNGCEVTVVTPFFEVFREISSVSRGHVIAVLDRHRVRIVANTRLVRVQDGAAILRNKFSGREEKLTAAAIHWIGSLRARDDLAKALVAAARQYSRHRRCRRATTAGRRHRRGPPRRHPGHIMKAVWRRLLFELDSGVRDDPAIELDLALPVLVELGRR